VKTKQLVGLLATVVVLVGYLMASSQGEVAVNQLGDTQVTLSELNASAATQIKVVRGDNTLIEIKKGPSGWALASGHAADSKKVEGLLKDLGSLKAEQRKANLSQLGTYGLAADDKKTVLTVSDGAGKALTSVAMGKKGPEWGSAWTQRQGKTEVLLMNEGAVGRLADGELKAKDWLNRQPAKMDMSTITSVRIAGEVTAELSLAAAAPDAGPAVWANTQGGEVASDKVAALGSTLSSTYVDGVASAGAPSSILAMTFGGTSGETKVTLSQSAEKTWVMAVGEHIYTIGESNAKSLRNKAREIVGMATID
jgi:hypothetical protein